MTGLCASLVFAALSLQAEPARLVMGKDLSAQLVLTAPNGAKVTGWASLGELSPAQNAGAGRFKFKYRPPAEHVPQVVLFLVQVESAGAVERAWLTLPLVARAELKVETKRRASVQVVVGTETFGPVEADANGHARVMGTVPPGVSTARIISTDRAGNSTQKPLDLKPRPYPRFHVLPAKRAGSWADGASVDVEVFAIEPDGHPLQRPEALHVRADRGTVGAAAAAEPGVFHFPYQPAEQLGAGQATLRVTLDGASGEEQAVIRLKAGSAEHLAFSLEPAAYSAGSGISIRVRATAADAKGNPVADFSPSYSVSMGELSQRSDGADWRLPDDFHGRTEALVTARSPRLESMARVQLLAGPPALGVFRFFTSRVSAGEPVTGHVQVRDAFGNHVLHTGATLADPSGQPVALREVGHGWYAFSAATPSEAPPGPFALTLKSPEAPLTQSQAVTLLSARRSWAFAFGPSVVVQDNFWHTRGVLPRFSLGLRLGSSHAEAVLEGDVGLFARFVDTANGVTGQVMSLSGTLGLRYTIPLAEHVGWHFLLAGGAARVRSVLMLSSDAQVRQTELATFPLMRVASGATLWAGPGRFLLQLEWSEEPAHGQLQGNAGGLSASAGYLFTF